MRKRPKAKPQKYKSPAPVPPPMQLSNPEQAARRHRMIIEAESCASGRPPKPACQLPR